MRPEIESVRHAPAGSLITSLGESHDSRIEPCGSIGIDHLTGIESDKMRYVSVGIFSDLAVVLLFAEFLYLSRVADEYRVVLIYLSSDLRE